MVQIKISAIAVCFGLTLGVLAPVPLMNAAAVPNPPPNGNPDQGREPAGTRGPCEVSDLPFTPLLPVSEDGFSGTTLRAHPSFWFYVPYTAEQTTAGRFALVSQDGTEVLYRTEVVLPETPGFVQIQVPTTASVLAVNGSYRWQFMLYCGDADALAPDFVMHRGSIQRIDVSALTRPVDTSELAQQVRGLVQNQVWYDVTADLAEIQAVPDLWSEVLGAIGLAAVEPVTTFGEAEPLP
jgi:hypothetical protein